MAEVPPPPPPPLPVPHRSLPYDTVIDADALTLVRPYVARPRRVLVLVLAPYGPPVGVAS